MHNYKYCVQAKSFQFCLTLCDFIEYSQPSSSVYVILQARKLEWVANLPPGDLPNTGIKPFSLTIPVLAGRFSTTWRRKWQQLQYSFLENPMYRGSWWSIVHGIAKSQSDMTELLTHYISTGTTWEAQIYVIGHKI